MPGHRTDPAHLRTDHGNRLAFDHRLQRHLDHLGSFGKLRAARTARAVAAKDLAGLAQLLGDPGPLQITAFQQVLDPGALLHQGVALGDQLQLFEAAQGPQAHVQYRFGLNFRQRHFWISVRNDGRAIVGLGRGAQMILCPVFNHQRLFWVIIIADDVDDTIQMQEGDDKAFKHLQAVIDLFQPVFAAPDQDVPAVVKEGAQHLFERTDPGCQPVNQHIHVEAEASFQIGVAKKHPHHDLRIDRLGTWFQHNADIVGTFVAHIGEQWHLLELDHFGQLFDQLGFLHLIRDLGDDDLPLPAAKILDLPSGAQAEGTAPGAIGLGDILFRLDDHTAGRKIRPGNVVEQRVITRVRRFYQMQAGVDQFMQVMRRNICRHPHSDPA